MSAAATTSLPPTPKPVRPNRALERSFFAFMSLLLLAAVLYGFGRSYFFVGMVKAPLPNKLVHVHGAVFSLWILLLLVQTALVTTKKIRVHRALGLYGFGLAVLMVVLGIMAAIDQLNRIPAGPFGMTPPQFLIIPLTAVGMFAGFIFWSWKARFQPATHKRLILLATIALMDAAISRWPIAFLQAHPPMLGVVELSFVVLILLYDLVSMHKLQKVTLIGFGIIMAVIFTRVPISQTKAWVSFASLFLHH